MQGAFKSSASHPGLAPDQFPVPSEPSLVGKLGRKKEALAGYHDNYFLSENFIEW